ncbi:MAG: hypothetical protein M1826_004878 [Phylliscum demangeonii]|nr:MAG: hypothetical protein M1826_004878 [Phylliscum demangeonii]
MCITVTLRSTICEHGYTFKPLGKCANPCPDQGCHECVLEMEMDSQCRDCVEADVQRSQAELAPILKQYGADEEHDWLWGDPPDDEEESEPDLSKTIRAALLALTIHRSAAVFNDYLDSFLDQIRRVCDGYPGRDVFRPRYGCDGIPHRAPVIDHLPTMEQVRHTHGLLESSDLSTTPLNGERW